MAPPRAERRPAAALAAFLRGRLEREAFVGLPLTLLGAVFVLLLFTFGGLTWGVLASDPLAALDARLAALLAAHREPAPTRVFLWLTFLGRGEIATAIALAAAAIFLLWFGWRKRAKFPVKPRSVGPGRVECPSRHEISLTARFAEQRKRDRLSDCHRTARNSTRDRLATGRLRDISSSFRVSVVFRPFPPT
jgi:hypothetical protein